MAEYTNPGAAASNALEQFMLQRQAQKRQELLDGLAIEREHRLAQDAADTHHERVQAAIDRQEEIATAKAKAAQDIKDKQQKSFEKVTSTLLPNDIVSNDYLQKLQEFGNLPSDAIPAPAAQPESLPGGGLSPIPAGPATTSAPSFVTGGGIAAVPPGQEQLGITPTRTGAIRFAGTGEQRTKLADDAELKALATTLSTASPGSPEHQQALLNLLIKTGDKAGLANLAKPVPLDKTPDHSIAMDPRTLKLYHVGTHIELTPEEVATLPKNFQPQRMAEPRDTTAHDTAAANQVQAAREHAYAELGKVQTNYGEQANVLGKLTTMLDQNTGKADSVIPEMYLRAMAGGQGSGLRMSQPLINMITQGSRSHWTTAELKLNAWKTANDNGEPAPPLIFTPEEKVAMKQAARVLQANVYKQLSKISTARHKVDEATTLSEVNTQRSAAGDNLYAPPPDTPEPVGAPAVVPPPITALPPGVTVTKRR